MRFTGWVPALLMLVPGWSAGVALADSLPEDRAFVSVYAGQGADHNLRELPRVIAQRNVDWDKTWFGSVGAGRIRGSLGQSIDSLQGTAFGAILHGYEAVFVKHHGLQSNAEAGAAYMLKTPDLRLAGVGVNFGAGAGLSYAVGFPGYEDGPLDDPGRRYRLQLLLLFDLEWRIAGFEKLSLITRVHHRSGVYGLIAPRHVGSNFLAVGIRQRF